MSVTIKELNLPIVKNEDIERIILDQLHAIDGSLRRHEVKWGLNIVEHIIINNFELPGLSRPDAETIIYTKIIKSIEERGFTVKFILKEGKTILYISWIAGNKKYSNFDEMKKYINKRQITSKTDILKNYNLDQNKIENLGIDDF